MDVDQSRHVSSKLNREEGLATIVRADGIQEWTDERGRLSRLDGPAVVFPEESSRAALYFIDGVELSETDWQKIVGRRKIDPTDKDLPFANGPLQGAGDALLQSVKKSLEHIDLEGVDQEYLAEECELLVASYVQEFLGQMSAPQQEYFLLNSECNELSLGDLENLSPKGIKVLANAFYPGGLKAYIQALRSEYTKSLESLRPLWIEKEMMDYKLWHPTPTAAWLQGTYQYLLNRKIKKLNKEFSEHFYDPEEAGEDLLIGDYPSSRWALETPYGSKDQYSHYLLAERSDILIEGLDKSAKGRPTWVDILSSLSAEELAVVLGGIIPTSPEEAIQNLLQAKLEAFIDKKALAHNIASEIEAATVEASQRSPKPRLSSNEAVKAWQCFAEAHNIPGDLDQKSQDVAEPKQADEGPNLGL